MAEFIIVIDTIVGRLHIESDGAAVTRLYLPNEAPNEDFSTVETPILADAVKQIYEYLDGKRKIFDVPLAPAGTPFMRAAWDSLIRVPFGQTKTYSQIAAEVGRGSARAAGSACARNPIPIFIPCHRIIGKSGSLTGFRGGLEMKKHLLEIENKYK